MDNAPQSVGLLWKSDQLITDIYHCRVYSEKIPDDGQRNCPKHLEFHARINL